MMFVPTGKETPEDVDDRIAELNACAPDRERRRLRLAAELAELVDSFRSRIVNGSHLWEAEQDPVRKQAIDDKLSRMARAKDRAQDALAAAYFGKEVEELRLHAAQAIFDGKVIGDE